MQTQSSPSGSSTAQTAEIHITTSHVDLSRAATEQQHQHMSHLSSNNLPHIKTLFKSCHILQSHISDNS